MVNTTSGQTAQTQPTLHPVTTTIDYGQTQPRKPKAKPTNSNSNHLVQSRWPPQPNPKLSDQPPCIPQIRDGVRTWS